MVSMMEKRWHGLRFREAEPELMDDWTQGGAELTEALRHLRRLNRLFGAAGPTLYGVKLLWAAAGKPRRLTVMDVGAGSGDVNRRLLDWAERTGVELHITIVDRTAEACEEAARFFGGEPRVNIRRGDLFQLAGEKCDIVTATQFVHHFADERLPDVFHRLLRLSKLGVVVNDIHRHRIPWLAVWLAARTLSRNRYIRHDAPLSVAKGFRRDDFMRLKEKDAVPIERVSWRPLFRYVVIARKKTGTPDSPGSAADRN